MFILEDVLGVSFMLFQHLLVVFFFDSAHYFCLIGLNILSNLLQKEDVVFELLSLLLDALDTCFLSFVKLFQVFFDAQLDSRLYSFVVSFQ